MNKLVIVGNGFDIAHDLKTSYGSFISNLWANLRYNYRDGNISNVLYINPLYDNYIDSNVKSFSEFKSCVQSYCRSEYINIKSYEEVVLPNGWYDSVDKGKNASFLFKFKNEFFYKLCNLHSIQNWVDIESFYYETLKEVSEGIREINGHRYKGDVKKLNREFEEVKNLLEVYLKEEVVDQIEFEYDKCHETVLSLFKNKADYLYNSQRTVNSPSFFDEFQTTDYVDLEIFNKNLIKSIEQDDYNKQNQLMFLDFNYTSTVDFYIQELNKYRTSEYPTALHISIHGKLNSKTNPINFGFGDEMDKYYKVLEDTNDNEYLRNIKSFQYLNNNNYRRLLEWIEGGKFQVIVIGHSCGLSDRTMLNTIFEHTNCRSIKVFYHERERDGLIVDNFTEIIQNISRNFNNKALMRTKIVNKTLCKPLPQDCQFHKKKSI